MTSLQDQAKTIRAVTKKSDRQAVQLVGRLVDYICVGLVCRRLDAIWSAVVVVGAYIYVTWLVAAVEEVIVVVVGCDSRMLSRTFDLPRRCGSPPELG